MRRALFLLALVLVGCASAPVPPRGTQRFPGTAQFSACKADCDADGAPGALVLEDEVKFDCWCKWGTGQVSRPQHREHTRPPEDT